MQCPDPSFGQNTHSSSAKGVGSGCRLMLSSSLGMIIQKEAASSTFMPLSLEEGRGVCTQNPPCFRMGQLHRVTPRSEMPVGSAEASAIAAEHFTIPPVPSSYFLHFLQGKALSQRTLLTKSLIQRFLPECFSGTLTSDRLPVESHA